jgi:hypothetical protein
MDEHPRVLPPAATVARHPRGFDYRETSGPQLAIDGRSPVPLFEMDGSESVTNPFVQVGENSGGVRQAEVLLPSQQVAPKPCAYLFNAPPDAFTARPPDLRHLSLDPRGFAINCSLAPLGVASDPVPVRRPAVSLPASFPRSVTLTQLRFASIRMVSFRRDLHPQDSAHAGRTMGEGPLEPKLEGACRLLDGESGRAQPPFIASLITLLNAGNGCAPLTK